MERPDEVLSGIRLLMRALGLDKAVLAVRPTKPMPSNPLRKG